MTARYDKFGLQFLYPENWKLIDHAEEATEQSHLVSLESSDGSSTWAVHAYDPTITPEAILKETIGALEETYEQVEIAPVEEVIAGASCTGIEAMFYCLDFLIRARLILQSDDNRTLLIWTQAEDRAYDQLEPVFHAISTSLLQPAAD